MKNFLFGFKRNFLFINNFVAVFSFLFCFFHNNFVLNIIEKSQQRKMLILRYFTIFLILNSIHAVYSNNGQLSTKDRIKLHREWLERRKASRAYSVGSSSDNSLDNSSNKITYLRKLIKFKNENEPIIENDVVRFIPKLNSNNFRQQQMENSTIVGVSLADENLINEITNTTGNINISGANDDIIVDRNNNKNNDVNTENDRFRYDILPSINNTINSVYENSDGNISNSKDNNENVSITHVTDNNGLNLKLKVEAETEEPIITTTQISPPDTTMALQITTLLDSTSTTSTTSDPNLNAENDDLLNAENGNLNNKLTTDVTVNENGKHIEFAEVENEKINATVRHVFGSWSAWTKCSRSCGGGVKSQHRKCWQREYINGKKSTAPQIPSDECIGLFKRFHLCNEHSCPESKLDFREEQCISYNKQIFQGKRYVWESYVKDDAECELNCKPVGMRYFATLNRTVIDGTLCTKPTEHPNRRDSKAICVEGICKVIHNSGVITGSFMNIGAVRCGDTICRSVSEIYDKSHLNQGYHHIATIPTGASNITITEMQHSVNFLVLKSHNHKFIINGDNIISPSGQYEAAGTVFDYRRFDVFTNGSVAEGVTEWITANGPIINPVHILLLSQQKNTGVKYEYLVPVHADPTTDRKNDAIPHQSIGQPQPHQRKKKYVWKIIGYNSCSKSCGGGIQTPIIKCIRESPLKHFPAKKCSHLKQPTASDTNMRCNTQPCPAYWKISEWSSCNCDNIGENDEIFRTREVKCVQELTSGIVIQVSNGACMDEKPAMKKRCECPGQKKKPRIENQNRRKHNHTSAISTHLQNHHNNRVSTQNDGHHLTEPKKNGIWLTSDWNKQCSAYCGIGFQHRSIFCDRNSSPNSERCDLRFTPDTKRECYAEKRCEDYGEWFAGPWHSCSGDCFNLTKSRSVFCVKEGLFIDDSNCDLEVKPILTESCDMFDVDDCKPRWHYSDWTECSKTCGEGIQKRIVKCLEPNLREKQMKESQSCLFVDKPDLFKKCNLQECVVTSTEYVPYADPRVDIIQNDDTCVDDFPNCNVVMKARLCNYAYYNEHCCHSCKTRLKELY